MDRVRPHSKGKNKMQKNNFVCLIFYFSEIKGQIRTSESIERKIPVKLVEERIPKTDEEGSGKLFLPKQPERIKVRFTNNKDEIYIKYNLL